MNLRGLVGVGEAPELRDRPLQRAPALAHVGPQVADARDARRHVAQRERLRPTSPRSTSSHVHGADTGAPGLARTAYAAANVAL